ncbi:hypothetical protein [Streptomyces sp. NPDC017520]|uniref:hypothetical protein n=1 Tax=Streptomyces sp. NPDC017520 TaxID=3364998 RepID=UPI0037BC8FD4
MRTVSLLMHHLPRRAHALRAADHGRQELLDAPLQLEQPFQRLLCIRRRGVQGALQVADLCLHRAELDAQEGVELAGVGRQLLPLGVRGLPAFRAAVLARPPGAPNRSQAPAPFTVVRRKCVPHHAAFAFCHVSPRATKRVLPPGES